MAGFPATAWIWWTAGAIVGLLATWLVYRSLLHDRSRGRRRCPKCWYDMSGTDSLTCSECGRTFKRERKLRKTRRRWRLTFVSMVLLLASATGMLTPKVQRDGWLQFVPMTGLILGLRWCEPGKSGLEKQIAAEFFRRGEIAAERAADGANEGRVWDWQLRLLLRASFDRLDPVQNHVEFQFLVYTALDSGLVTRLGLGNELIEQLSVGVDLDLHDRWPVGWPLYGKYKITPTCLFFPASMFEVRPVRCVTETGAQVDCRQLQQNEVAYPQISDAVIELDVTSLRQTQRLTVEFDVFAMMGSPEERRIRVGSCSTSFAVDFVGALDDYLTPIVAERSNESVQNCSSWSIATADREQFRVYLAFPRDCSDELPRHIITPRVALMHRDRVVASEVAVTQRDLIAPDFSTIDMSLSASALPPIREDDLEWALRLTGDPTWALREGWSRYWAGSAEFPIRWVREGKEWVARSPSDDSPSR